MLLEGATEEFVRARARAPGPPIMLSTPPVCARYSVGAMGPSKIDGRRVRAPWGPASACSRSEPKRGPGGLAGLVKRHVSSGSWMN